MEYDVFISYSRKDTQIVDQFVRSLTDAGYRVWIDRDGISSGDQFTKIIPKAIKSSAIVIFFSSANSNSSKWTVMEIGYALKKEKTIIPIRLDDTEYEDSIDFLLTLIDFIPYNPQQPSACIDRLITSLAAHGCSRSDSQANETANAPTQPDMSPEELFSLGKEHYDNEEYDQAVECFRKAAEQRNADAQNGLGVCFNNGQGVQQDDQQAVYWYREAAEQGFAKAQDNLGICYYKGEGVQQDYQQAVYWYQKAAEQGYAAAQTNLGICYECGYGVKKNFRQAANWYQKAAEQGNADAQFFLGCCYARQIDYQQAVYWYKKAVEQGHAGAQNNLGMSYEWGDGVLKDIQQAIYWYRKAAEQGQEYAIKRLKRLNAW